MQGRILQVLNMKPIEVLSMIEEAAGTRMFEEKKDKAVKTMAKKDAKLTEINSLLSEIILPKIALHKEEQRLYLEFEQRNKENERLMALNVAYDYVKYSKEAANSRASYEQLQKQQGDISRACKSLMQDIQDSSKDLADLKKREREAAAKNSKARSIETKLKLVSDELTAAQTQLQLAEANISNEVRELEDLKSHTKELGQQIQVSEQAIVQKDKVYEEARSRLETFQKKLREDEELYQTLTTGLSSTEGKDRGYQDQLQAAKSSAIQHQTDIERAQLRMKNLNERIAELEPQVNEHRSSNQNAQKKVSSLRQEIQALEAAATVEVDQNILQECTKRRNEQQRLVASLQSEVDALENQLSRLNFQYDDPSPNFNRNSVKGLVAKLIKIPEEQKAAVTALEVVAGGKLYNVVVDDEVVSSQLLKKGNLRRQVTIIPLSKIQTSYVRPDQIKSATRISQGKANVALSFIGYDNEVKAAMQYVFGSTLICQDKALASMICYDQSVRMRVVTLEGDIHDPSGLLTGGSRTQSYSILEKVASLQGRIALLETAEMNLENITQTMNELNKKLNDKLKAEQMLDLKKHELHVFEQELTQSANGQIIMQSDKFKAELQSAMDSVSQLKASLSEANKRVKHIEKEMKEFSTNKTGKIKKLQSGIASDKLEYARMKESSSALSEELLMAKGDLETIKSDVQSATEKANTLRNVLDKSKADIETMKREHAAKSGEASALEAALAQEQSKLSEYSTEIANLEASQKQQQDTLEQQEMQLNRVHTDLQAAEKKKASADKYIKDLEAAHKWIPEKKHLFGKPGKGFDLDDIDIKDLKARLHHLSEELKQLKKKVNPKVNHMLERVLQNERDLQVRLKTVNRDREKIQSTIDTLDEYKRDALNKTWKHVNTDFGQIFGELLSGGNSARLMPVDETDLLRGLMIQINLGGTWKKSLAELSGGQRSLAALSLILSLLQFKPAPMYILDEVDAALDLSHTQNIGHLFRTRFSESQFLVVSLKEGMFNNANVLFRAKFSESGSKVERYGTENKLQSDHNISNDITSKQRKARARA